MTAAADVGSGRIVDSHHHLWDPAIRAYPWMEGDALAPIRRRFGADELATMTATTGAVQTVLVQTVGDLAETIEFCDLAADPANPVAGVVGWVDLTAPDTIEDTLAAVRGGRGGDRLVGIRHQVQDEADPDWLRRHEVEASIRAVGAHDLAYDLLVLTHQLDAACHLAGRLDSVRFVVDHAAKPPLAVRGDALEAWASGIRRLAGYEHVTCKLSGLVTESGMSFGEPDPEPFRWVCDVLLDAFGPARLMYGSDWPVCLLAAEPDVVVGIARLLIAELSPSEQTAVFSGNARRIYRLPESAI